MEDEKEKEEAAQLEFSAFPFKPYGIQTRFMTAVYRALQQGGVAIVESPTGTGKTLSLICSALKWLEDEHALRLVGRPKAELQSSSLSNGVDEDPDWMRDFEVNKEEQRRREKEERKQQLKKLQKSNLSMSRVSTARSFFGDAEEDDAYFNRKRQNGQVKKKSVRISSANEDDEFLIEDYCSDDNAPRDGALKRKTNKDVSSSSDEDVEEDDDEEEVEPLKVFFCSRTHSQLSQFVGELQRTAFNSSLQSVTIGSRKTLCINPEVMKLGSSARINECCLELHKSKSNEQTGTKFVKEAGKQRKMSKSAGCPMLQKKKLQRQFKDELAKSGALDIEDLLKLGHRLGTCPYYGARQAVPAADLVVLPYQSLLHSATRESLGVKLKDCVIIIDEAHNLVDTVTSIHSCQVTASQLQQVSSQLSEYLEKFKARLAEGNCHYIQTLLQLIKAFLDRLSAPKATSSAPSHRGISNGADIGAKKADIMNINDFSFSLGIESINLFKLRRYIKESNIVHKVSSYGEKIALEQIIPLQQRNGLAIGSMLQSSSSMTGFHALADVILALTNADADGRILVVPNSGKNCEPTDGYIKFVMLNAAKHFIEVVKEARAVVLAGGTLQPISQLYDCLFPHLPPEKVHTFSCGHIVPPDSILPIALARGPGGHTFNFTYQSRGTPIMVDELGRLISNISSVVPEGIVVFFPSFEYENQVYTAWESKGILAAIEAKKHVLREPRNTSAVEATLQEYKESITQASDKADKTMKGNQRGAILLCVVGGKMSEGINFSDGMGRCVVMVGLPYPSPSDPELMERMRYLDSLPTNQIISGSDKLVGGVSGIPSLQPCRQRGREYYENLCMKAVNQSIGRAIRHIGDYAAILLVDARYTSGFGPQGPNASLSGPASKLPGWIKERLVNVTGSFGEVHRLLHQFFKLNQQRCKLVP